MASTAIEMLTLTPCRKMMVFGMESGPESDVETDMADTVEGVERKRSLSEADDDQERGQVKKRRKQSKPVRIASTEPREFNGDLLGLPPFETAKETNGNTTSSNSSTCSSSVMSEEYGPKVRADLKEDPDEVREGNTMANGSTLLPMNLSNMKSSFLEGFVRSQECQGKQEENAPTPYQDNPEGYKKDNMFASTSSSSPLPYPQVKHVAMASSGSPGLRIFNPEAFCDLCNKEFCNKYFLKTHKANKHGIYMENTGPSVIDALPPLPFINYFSSTNEVLPPNTSSPNTPRPPIKKPPHTIPFPQQNPATAAAFLLKNTANNVMKAYCNICQREFCNKYFVRRHKAKIHGIIEPGYSDNSMDFDQKLQYNQEKYDEVQEISKTPPEKEEPRIFPQKQPDQESEDSSKNSSPGAVPSSIHSIFGIQLEDSNEKFKKIGVVNSEAFCDICCKEYCNKYFLRTHRLKSHGIIPTDLDKKEMMLAEQSMYNQPLNLIVGDPAEKSDVKTRDQESEEESVCNICGRSFKTLFLLKMHNSYVHDKDFPEKPCQEEEFQKIHSMILKLNGTNDTGFCEICRRDFGHPSYLETHIVNEHANLLEEMGTIEDSDSQVSTQKECNICQKSFPNNGTLEQHVLESHPADQGFNPKPQEDFIKSQPMYPQSDVQTTPTSSFCEICKKELCNKYFMKTHMQRMHGISIENGAHIGGVVCDICNKELCSKYFLRVHKQNSHGIVDDVLGLDMSRNQSPNADSSLRPSEQNDLNNRYFSHFTEVCAICSRRFRSMKWLKAHLLNDHGDEGKDKWREFQNHFDFRQMKEVTMVPKKPETHPGVPGTNGTSRVEPQRSTNGDNNFKSDVFSSIFNGKNTTTKQYQCSYCNFSTSMLAFLFVHERSHVGTSGLLLENQKFLCQICNATFETSESLEKHRLTHDTLRNLPNDPGKPEFSLEEDDARHLQDNGSKSDEYPGFEFKKEAPERQDNAEKINGALIQVKESLDLIANKTEIPVSFSVPQSRNQSQVIMQPFVLEDSGQFISSNNKKKSFLSSIVFLPVKERLKTPVMASFKLTPT